MEKGATTDTAPTTQALDGRRHFRKIMWTTHRRKRGCVHSDETGVLPRVEVRVALQMKGDRDHVLLFGVVVTNRAWVPWDVACHPKPNHMMIQAGK